MSKGHAVLKFLRKIHLYVGVFTTPALLFFAITGAFQTFSLHETTQGSNYKPPAWIATLAQLHKKQTTVVPPRRPRPAGSEDAPRERRQADSGSPKGAGGPSHASGTAPSDPVASASTQPAPASQSRPAESPSAPRKSHLPMKIFFLLVSLSLVTSALTGIYLSYKYSRGWWILTGLLVAGVVVPVLLLPF